ncbi:MAG: hypothetical protein ACRC02_05270, partial [Vogesella sp.]|uniref:hypothetical protein n=1 Tax=Vogesella sp. TaxID=1904252 RepID=UPI003F37E86B
MAHYRIRQCQGLPGSKGNIYKKPWHGVLIVRVDNGILLGLLHVQQHKHYTVVSGPARSARGEMDASGRSGNTGRTRRGP